MCDQAPDEILLNGKRVAIEPLPIVESEFVAYIPEDMLKTTADTRGYVAYWALIAD